MVAEEKKYPCEAYADAVYSGREIRETSGERDATKQMSTGTSREGEASLPGGHLMQEGASVMKEGLS
jgi:hypothetical protein